jgi:hypothetical protein
MAKYSQASDSIENLVIEISNELGLINYGVDFQPLCVNKAKEVCKIVKANELAEYASNREDLVFVVCYEDAFDLVDEKTQYMWLRMEMEKVAYDTEKDKMIIGCPQITVPVGFYEKYKGAAVESALLGQYTIAQIEEKKKEEAEQRKALKTKMKKK